jgi:multidrug resistance efflux pump
MAEQSRSRDIEDREDDASAEAAEGHLHGDGEQRGEPKPEHRARGRRWIWIVLVLCVLIFTYNLIADRLTPYTAHATVQAYVVGIAPEVAGNIVAVQVRDNARVKQGDVLFRIDPQRFDNAVASAEASLAQAGQTVGASTAEVAAAEANVARARADLSTAEEQSNRVFQLVERGVYAAARGDEARRRVDGARAAVEQADAQLEQARQNLGPQGADNPQIRAAAAALQQARLDLIRTTVVAPSDGIITNLRLTTGQYANVGQPVMTFIDVGAAWIEANFRENNLGNIKADEPVDIALDMWPGMIFPGTVESIAWGVDTGGETSASGLPTIRTPTGWLREAQRFPVRILFAGEFPRGTRLGSQANVVVYVGDNPVVNALAWLWIRLVTWLSYVY